MKKLKTLIQLFFNKKHWKKKILQWTLIKKDLNSNKKALNDLFIAF